MLDNLISQVYKVLLYFLISILMAYEGHYRRKEEDESRQIQGVAARAVREDVPLFFLKYRETDKDMPQKVANYLKSLIGATLSSSKDLEE